MSVVVPVYNGEDHLDRCLDAILSSKVAPLEVLVVNDASTDHSAAIARSKGTTVVETGCRSGPAHARNRGAAAAAGDILVFIDADVAVGQDTIGNISTAFASSPDLHALMGSYDNNPPERALISLYKNLQHHYVHQHGRQQAVTFWAGCGAIRRATYLALGGMNEAFDRPSIEDVELGYRLYQAGLRCELFKEIQATHLKRWTLRSLIRTDLFGRAVPWTELMLGLRLYPNDLNVSSTQMASTLLALALPCAVAASIVAPPALAVALGFLGAFLWLNRELYSLFYARGGIRLVAAAIPLHWLYSAYCALGFGIGLLRHVRRRLSGKPHVFVSSLRPPSPFMVEQAFQRKHDRAE